MPAAAFQAALSGHTRRFRVLKRRLKAGSSQDWLPHKFCRPAEARELCGIAQECVRHKLEDAILAA